MKASATRLLSVLLTLFAFFQISPLAHAKPGDLDLTFAGTGKTVVGFGGGQARANAAAAQPDGKLILAGFRTRANAFNGDFLLTRFTTNNLLDPTFGVGGKAITMLTTNDSAINALAIQLDGKIIAAGYAYRNPAYADFALVRYNPDGTPDTTFGPSGNGIVFTSLGQQARINAIAIQNDGKIVVDGNVGFPGANNAGYGIARYQTNGLLDPNFGSGGVIAVPGTEYDALYGLGILPDQRIVAVGGGPGAQFAIYRFTTNGATDTSFGAGSGHVYTSFSPGFRTAQGSAVTFQAGATAGSADKIVAVGTYNDYTVSPSKTYQLMIRYGMDGTLDSTFGSGGIVINLIGNGFPAPTGVQVFGAGSEPRKIVVGGSYSDVTGNYFAANRFTVSGGLDSTFGANSSGKITIPVNPAAEEASGNALTVQSGNFVVAGYSGLYGNGYQFTAARFTAVGLVDTNFGAIGLLLADVADNAAQARAVAVQTDGKIVAVGHSAYLTNNNTYDRFALARFNADGSLDNSFGKEGKTTLSFDLNNYDDANAVVILPNGKILAGGSDNAGGFALARFNSNGSLDASFGTNGISTTPIGGASSAQINSLMIQPDGKILAGGVAAPSGISSFALARFSSNGIPDSSFGSAGSIVTTFAANYDFAQGIGLQPDGKITLAGTAIGIVGAGSFTADFATARYTTNGSLDFSYGSLGRATGNVGSSTLDVGYAMAIQPDGKILVAGGAGLGFFPGPILGNVTSVNAFLALMRFNTNGTPDNTFGIGGSVITQVGNFSDFATSMVLQPDGKIIVGGSTQNGIYRFFALRYATNGDVDTSYGNNGATVVDFGTQTNEFAYGMALDDFGRVLLAGDVGSAFGLARLQGNAIPGPMLKIHLTATNTAVVTWPYPSTGWNLKECTNPIAPFWTTPAQSISNDGTNNFIMVNPAASGHFYRLQNP